MIKTILQGHRYMKIWPQHAVVGNLPEARVIPLTKLGRLGLPLAALLNVFVQYSYLGAEFLIQIMATSLFLAALPLQGYYWLGKRAKSQLPIPLASWLKELQSKLKRQGEDIRLEQHQVGPNYMDLAKVLHAALKKLPPNDY